MLIDWRVNSAFSPIIALSRLRSPILRWLLVTALRQAAILQQLVREILAISRFPHAADIVTALMDFTN